MAHKTFVCAALPLVLASVVCFPALGAHKAHAVAVPTLDGSSGGIDAAAGLRAGAGKLPPLRDSIPISKQAQPSPSAPLLEAHPDDGALHELAAACNILPMVQATVGETERSASQLESKLQGVAAQQDAVAEAARELLSRLGDIAKEVATLESRKAAAIQSADYAEAAKLQQQVHDAVAAQVQLEADVNAAWGHADKLMGLAGAIKEKQVAAHEQLADRLQSLAAAAEAARAHLAEQVRMAGGRAELSLRAAESAEAELSLTGEVLQLSRMVGAAEEKGVQMLAAAQEQLEQSRQLGSSLLGRLADLSLESVHADVLGMTAEQFAKAQRRLLDLAVQAEALEQAATLASAGNELSGVAGQSRQAHDLLQRSARQLEEAMAQHLYEHSAKQDALRSAQQLLLEARQMRDEIVQGRLQVARRT